MIDGAAGASAGQGGAPCMLARVAACALSACNGSASFPHVRLQKRGLTQTLRMSAPAVLFQSGRLQRRGPPPAAFALAAPLRRQLPHAQLLLLAALPAPARCITIFAKHALHGGMCALGVAGNRCVNV